MDVGQTVQQSMSVATFFTIATNLTSLKLTAGVDEADIGKIRPHMDVSFTVDSYPNQTFAGTVNSVRLNATTSNNVVTYPVWIDVMNPDLKLRPSMTATVKIIVSTAPDAIRIPNQALRFRPTTDMYAALGLTPPPAGRGRGGRAAGAGAARRHGSAAGIRCDSPGGRRGEAAAGCGSDRRRRTTRPSGPGHARARRRPTRVRSHGAAAAGRSGAVAMRT